MDLSVSDVSSLPFFPFLHQALLTMTKKTTGDGEFVLSHAPCPATQAVPLCCSELQVSTFFLASQTRPRMADICWKSLAMADRRQVPTATCPPQSSTVVPPFPHRGRAFTSCNMRHGSGGSVALLVISSHLHLFARPWLFLFCFFSLRGRENVPTTGLFSNNFAKNESDRLLECNSHREIYARGRSEGFT